MDAAMVMARVDTLAVDTRVGESAALQADEVADSAAMLAVAAMVAADTGKLPAIYAQLSRLPVKQTAEPVCVSSVLMIQ
jgi:hypothetical protein